MSSTIAVTLTVFMAVNLVLLLGVVRRLNALTVPVQAGRSGDGESDPTLPRAGTRVSGFSAAAFGGDRVTAADLRGETLVGFFTTGCPPCKSFAGDFMAYAATFPGGRRQVFAVISGGSEDPAELAALLSPAAQVVVEPPRGPMSSAFGVDLFPSACTTRDDVITAAEFDVGLLAAVRS
jgi:thiol-disulfide isomerase/thioredoxin